MTSTAVSWKHIFRISIPFKIGPVLVPTNRSTHNPAIQKKTRWQRKDKNYILKATRSLSCILLVHSGHFALEDQSHCSLCRILNILFLVQSVYKYSGSYLFKDFFLNLPRPPYRGTLLKISGCQKDMIWKIHCLIFLEFIRCHHHVTEQ